MINNLREKSSSFRRRSVGTLEFSSYIEFFKSVNTQARMAFINSKEGKELSKKRLEALRERREIEYSYLVK